MSYEIKDPDAPMTWKQGITIRNLGGGDVRGENLTKQQASDRIAQLMTERGMEALPSGGKGRSLKDVRAAEFQKLWDEAVAAGLEAGKAALPTPMVVTQHTNPLNDNGPVENQWLVNEGACGFAWVIVKPGTSAFAKWLKEQGHARRDSYYGGVSIWISDYNQSVERKAAHAGAMARVFEAAGIKATPMSRLD